jgi:GT2 family glycosyltransferase
MAELTILIPTRDRPAALLATLTTLCAQTYRDFSVVIANQGDPLPLLADPSTASVRRLLALHGQTADIIGNLPPRGIAQQRQFLLDQTATPYCLFLDDDVLLEPFVVRNLMHVMKREQCGFAGCPLIGLSYADDLRTEEEAIAFWDGQVAPETVTPDMPAWQRYRLHNAANVLHVQEGLALSEEEPQTYKVAWVGGCVLYDTAKLRDVGGFEFWRDLPPEHSGEDVLVQLRLMKRFGGCGVLPSGAYHQELPTTISERKVNAVECLAI